MCGWVQVFVHHGMVACGFVSTVNVVLHVCSQLTLTFTVCLTEPVIIDRGIAAIAV